MSSTKLRKVRERDLNQGIQITHIRQRMNIFQANELYIVEEQN